MAQASEAIRDSFTITILRTHHISIPPSPSTITHARTHFLQNCPNGTSGVSYTACNCNDGDFHYNYYHNHGCTYNHNHSCCANYQRAQLHDGLQFKELAGLVPNSFLSGTCLPTCQGLWIRRRHAPVSNTELINAEDCNYRDGNWYYNDSYNYGD